MKVDFNLNARTRVMAVMFRRSKLVGTVLFFLFEILQEHCIAFKKEACEVLQSCDYK